MFFLNKTRRRVIFWLAVIFFLLAAPLIIAYSQGLRFDFATREIVRVGAIAIDSDPDEARIVFNGEVHKSDTPTVIRGLLPGHLFHIKVENEGYYPWEKTLTVDAQRITSARGIHLFGEQLNFISVASGTTEASFGVSQNSGERIFFHNNNNAYVLDVETATSTVLAFPDTQPTAAIDNIEWHQNGSHVLFSRRTSVDLVWYVWDVEQNSLVNLNQVYVGLPPDISPETLAPEEFNAVNVTFLRNGASRFLASLEGRVYLFNTADGSFSDAGIDNVALLYSAGNRFFVVNAESTLIEIDANGNLVRTYGTLGFIPERMLLSPNGQRLFYESNGRGGGGVVTGSGAGLAQGTRRH